MSFSLAQILRGQRKFSGAVKVNVWNKARVAPGMPSHSYRLDPCGALLEWSKYGDTTPGGNGWQIDKVVPYSLHGTDHVSNLQAIHWQNNQVKYAGRGINLIRLHSSAPGA